MNKHKNYHYTVWLKHSLQLHTVSLHTVYCSPNKRETLYKVTVQIYFGNLYFNGLLDSSIIKHLNSHS